MHTPAKDADTRLLEALRSLPPKSGFTSQADKKNWSQQLSTVVSQALADELLTRGLTDVRPLPASTRTKLTGGAGERVISGGMGSKKVDVSWATAAAGLMLGVSIKSINFADTTTNNFQKNLTNRRGDMLFESTTLHRRFPFAVLAGFFFMDALAEKDSTPLRRSTVVNAHQKFRIFTGRDKPDGADERYERLYFLLHTAGQDDPMQTSVSIYPAGNPAAAIRMADAIDDLLELVAERNSDFYEYNAGMLMPA